VIIWRKIIFKSS